MSILSTLLVWSMATAVPAVSTGAVTPQPGKPVCGWCSSSLSLTSGDTLNLSFNADYADEIKSIAVTAYARKSSTSLWFDIDDLTPSSTAGSADFIVDVDLPNQTKKIVLDFEMTDGSIISESIPIYIID